MDKDTAEKMTAHCGIPCFHCPIYLASEDPGIRKVVAKTLNIPEEKAKCKGCKPAMGFCIALNEEVQCKIYECATKKNISFCFECQEFPCNRFQPYADNAQYPHNTKMYQLCMIKKLGVEKWANEEAKKIWDTYRSKPFDFNNILY